MAIARREFVRLTVGGLAADRVANAPSDRGGTVPLPLRPKAIAFDALQEREEGP
jgi:hypothetical protein